MAVERPHLLVAQPGRRLDFASKSRASGGPGPPPVERRDLNASRIIEELQAVLAEGAATADDDTVAMSLATLPVSVRATTEWGVTPTVPGGPEVLSKIGFEEKARTNIAWVAKTFDKLQRAADKYIEYDEGPKPHYFNFFESAPQIAMTTVDDLWASDMPIPEGDDEAAWEIWLKPEREERIRQILRDLDLRSRVADAVVFETACILPVYARRTAMDRLARSASVAQLRPASSLNAGLIQMTAAVQTAAVTAAVRRVTPANDGAPSVCVLDTGVSDHPLLAPSTKVKLVVGGTYTPHDYDGHGTKMAGLALFSDLPGLLTGGVADLLVDLESVAVQPPPGAGDTPTLPAARVRDAVAAIEAAREAKRTFCFAMNAPEEASDGVPSSLSTELDKLAFNPARRRLFCASAGNLPDTHGHQDYQSANEFHGIQAPAQAWNVLTVAACTDLETELGPLQALAPQGDLCPWSRTAVNWDRDARPPSKPDIVFEGGNQQLDPVTKAIAPHPGLLMLTTSNDAANPLCLTGQTSAATAAAAGFCARLQAEYPLFWPETIRGLMVHATEHTPAMRARVAHIPEKYGQQKAALLARYGYGRPDTRRALENARNSLTLIQQGELLPVRLNEKKQTVLGEMAFHSLPWPIEILDDLGDERAELRVTLSYFIEPNAGAALIGAFDQYASHGLDFSMRRPKETEEQTISRLNKLVAGETQKSPKSRWEFGDRQRGRGGLKHDRWTGPARELAEMGGVAVFPRGGWWSKDAERVGDLVCYSLIVSIRTREEEIYTAIPIEIAAA
ncbi:MAG: hypothetical protein JWO72_1188 [Caulobacteraceae bacterium]|nr:hypothetical protein [Caulobacteraceae bacterium]